MIRFHSRVWCLPLAALLLVAKLPVHALDFSLHSASVEEDGFRREQWFFQNDAQSRVVVGLPAGWTHSGDTAALTLTPLNVTNGMVKIEKSAIGPGVPFTDRGLEVYRKRLLSDIPPGAVGMKWTGEVADPLPIFHWTSHEFTAEYEFFGHSYRRGVLFVNLDAREQLMVTTIAPKESYERVRAAGLDVLRSWQVVPESR